MQSNAKRSKIAPTAKPRSKAAASATGPAPRKAAAVAQPFHRRTYPQKLVRAKGLPSLAQELQNQMPVTSQQISAAGGQIVGSLDAGTVYWLPDWSLLVLMWQGEVALSTKRGFLRKKK